MPFRGALVLSNLLTAFREGSLFRSQARSPAKAPSRLATLLPGAKLQTPTF